MSSSETNPDFMKEMASVEPLVQDKIVTSESNQTTINDSYRQKVAVDFAPKNQNFLTDGEVNQVEPDEILSFKLDGVQPNVFKKLRQGKYLADFHLDLHRKTVAEARNEIYRLMVESQRREFRTLIITHGKGAQSNPPARLKSYVYHWLKQLELVVAFHSTIPRDGGTGSVYVLLRKSARLNKINQAKYD